MYSFKANINFNYKIKEFLLLPAEPHNFAATCWIIWKRFICVCYDPA